MLLPLVIGGVCIVGSIIGTFFVRLGASNNIMGALYKGLIAAGGDLGVLIAGRDRIGCSASTPCSRRAPSPSPAGTCSIARWSAWSSPACWSGSPNTTPRRPIVRCAASPRPRPPATAPTSSRASRSRWKPTALPVIVICAGIIAAYPLAGLFGIAIAATTHAGAGRHGRGARCLRSGDRQRRRHRRDGGPAARKCARPPTRSTPSATPPRR